jgi:hypothetical protein
MRALVLAVAMLAAGAGALRADQVVPADSVARRVAVEDVRRDPDAIRGRLVNRGTTTVTRIEVLATDAFRWTDERHPGTDDPGQAGTVTVAGPLAPGASLPFAVGLPPRPVRTDGTFVPSASVVGFTEASPAP